MSDGQVRQYKLERECNAVINQIREEKVARMESLMDGALSSKDYDTEELVALKLEHKVCDIEVLAMFWLYLSLDKHHEIVQLTEFIHGVGVEAVLALLPIQDSRSDIQHGQLCLKKFMETWFS